MLAGSRNTTTATSRRVASPIPRTTNGKCPVPKDPAWLWARPARLCPAVRLRLGAAPSGPAQRPGWIQPTRICSRSPQCPNARVVPRGPTWHECPNGRDCTQMQHCNARRARLCPAVRLCLGAAPSGPAQWPGWIQPTRICSRSPQCPNARVVPRGPTWHECPNGRDCTQMQHCNARRG